MQRQVALGHRRLRIIDLQTGRQPMANETGSIQVILNGEIYNFDELRTRLQDRHHFSTQSDTEVIVHAWEEFGDDCVAHFNGMFAFALWDAERGTLMLARDRLGEKPLYYGPAHRSLHASRRERRGDGAAVHGAGADGLW